ncbi:protein-(glutamine-N5) methyltransferase, release factor-specific [Propionibacterium sp. oral taxon 192 str. F0372]|uniref:peptide chain release factor N(5)-glutamine methyltransferase n=1 Tax=Propionibacterium sp. oral taxon 192 TaxID=671222 RepID=UPI0003530B21|nr:peptide chain release factor N(5)-glutamine methyltransferase [Propionibacterium sp. oral taxon 192]EPH02676.1 protein-(glutamine-N5) methyltransferase, release factor-specific [Propionibacterium sp. oral taxon 192 str. F0372]
MRWSRLQAIAVESLQRSGIAAPSADARWLAQHLLGVDQIGLLTAADPSPEQIEAYAALVARRAAHEPLQHIVGWAPFRGLRIAVGPGVFVPRPETESVAQTAIEILREMTPQHPDGLRWVELCAGTGAITASVLLEVPRVRGWAVEKHEAACAWTRRNLAGTGAVVVCQDMADALGDLDGSVDVVVANPPYIPWCDLEHLPEEVVAYDPHTALFADDDGCADIAMVIATAARLLRAGGAVVIEHGDDQQQRVLRMLGAADFEEPAGHRDLAGRPRHVSARRVPVLGG